jgi:hypothetical protein
VLRILSLSDLKPLEIDSPRIRFGLRWGNFPLVLRYRLQVEVESSSGGGLGPRGRCGLLGVARGWHGGRACGGVLTVAMVTGPTMMDWSRPRQEVGQGRPSPIGSSRMA